MITQVEYSVVGRSRDRVTPCAVCTVHVETRSAGFLVEPQNQGRTVSSGLGSKPAATVSGGLASEPAVMIFTSFASKQVVTVFSSLASKLVRLRRRQVEDGRINVTGCVGSCYPTFAISNVLGPRGVVLI